MRKLLLLLALAPLQASSQNSELGISAGIGLNSAPSGTLYYKADKGGRTPVVAITQLWNLNRYSESPLTWQAGAAFYGFMGLRNESDKTYTYFTDTIGNDGRTFRYANFAYALGPVVNIKYKLSDIMYTYGGISAGISGSRNTSYRSTADLRGNADTYTAPDGGLGFYGRVHAGATYRLSQRIGINAEVGYSYNHLRFKVDDLTYPGGTDFTYNTSLLSFTAGIRYRVGWPKEISRKNGRRRIVKEDIETGRKKDKGQ